MKNLGDRTILTEEDLEGFGAKSIWADGEYKVIQIEKRQYMLKKMGGEQDQYELLIELTKNDK